jgi:hypothetical protein
MTYQLVDLAKPGQRYTHGWVPIAGAMAGTMVDTKNFRSEFVTKKSSPKAKVEKARAQVADYEKRYGYTHPMAKRARRQLEAVQRLQSQRSRAKRAKAKHHLMTFLELA